MHSRLRDVYRRVGRYELIEAILESFVGGEECARRRYCDGYDGADALIETSEQRALRRSICIFIVESVVWRLYASLERVERIDQQVNGKGSKCAGLYELSACGDVYTAELCPTSHMSVLVLDDM
jgi:hypothetical protein